MKAYFVLSEFQPDIIHKPNIKKSAWTQKTQTLQRRCTHCSILSPNRFHEIIQQGETTAPGSMQNKEQMLIATAVKGEVIVIWGIHEYLSMAHKQLTNKHFNRPFGSDQSWTSLE